MGGVRKNSQRRHSSAPLDSSGSRPRHSQVHRQRYGRAPSSRRGRSESKGEQPSGPIEHTAAVHVSLRIESGFDLVQIMAEYRALRSCVLRMWRQSYPDSFGGGAAEITRFAEAIDQNVAEAVPYYQERESQYRDRFLGILGHDLRTPINAITLGAYLLAQNGLNEKQRGTVSRILNSARRLSRMVSDLLDFSRG